MRIVLLSGGSGKRLWPLSNEIRSKIFVKLLPGENGGRESMIQRLCRQLAAEGLLESASIVTHESQIAITQNHVGDSIPLIGEPYKRGTFTAIALAVSQMHEQGLASADDTICVIPTDSFVEVPFIRQLRRFPDVLRDSGAEVALLGTRPGYPSSQYGYMVPRLPGSGTYFHIDRFVEKPDAGEAARLLEQGALWNCGVFAFRLSFMLDAVAKRGLPVQYDALAARYEQLPERSFDHEIVETAQRTAAIAYEGSWHDLGSWSTFAEHLDSTVTGRGQVSGRSGNTHLVNELNVPVHVIDVPNAIVAASPDGILVADKAGSSRIKELLQAPQQPMYEETRGGSSRVIDRTLAAGQPESVIRRMTLQAGRHVGYHWHKRRTEVWTIVSGSGELLLDGTLHAVQSGDVYRIPAGVPHALRAHTALDWVEIQLGSELDEDDTVLAAASWEEAVGDPSARDSTGDPETQA